jgi:hypothetical protein
MLESCIKPTSFEKCSLPETNIMNAEDSRTTISTFNKCQVKYGNKNHNHTEDTYKKLRLYTV